MLSIAHEDKHNAIAIWTGIADRVHLTSIVLPAMFTKLPFHRGIRATMASMSACSSPFFNLNIDNGMPR
jgi:hypothetical protein